MTHSNGLSSVMIDSGWRAQRTQSRGAHWSQAGKPPTARRLQRGQMTPSGEPRNACVALVWPGRSSLLSIQGLRLLGQVGVSGSAGSPPPRAGPLPSLRGAMALVAAQLVEQVPQILALHQVRGAGDLRVHQPVDAAERDPVGELALNLSPRRLGHCSTVYLACQAC